MGTFNMGSVTAARDVNLESTVTNTGDTNITVNYSNLRQELKGLARTPEEEKQMEELGNAIEKKDESMVTKIVNSLSENGPLLFGLCRSLLKVIF